MLTKILFFVKDFCEKNFLYTRFGILRRFGGFDLICELHNQKKYQLRESFTYAKRFNKV